MAVTVSDGRGGGHRGLLRRHGRVIAGSAPLSEKATTRFEHPSPNNLWQMDFKGHFPLTDPRAGRCHPLTILDDHSRFVSVGVWQ